MFRSLRVLSFWNQSLFSSQPSRCKETAGAYLLPNYCFLNDLNCIGSYTKVLFERTINTEYYFDPTFVRRFEIVPNHVVSCGILWYLVLSTTVYRDIRWTVILVRETLSKICSKPRPTTVLTFVWENNSQYLIR